MVGQLNARESGLPASLVVALRQGKLVPFAGAGVSMHVKQRRDPSKSLFLTWSELLAQGASELEKMGKSQDAVWVKNCLNLRPPKLMEAAAHIKERLRGPQWQQFLKAALDPKRDLVAEDSLDLPGQLWRLGSQLVITTNYDKTLQWSCPDADNLDVWHIQHPAELSTLAAGKMDRPVLWHLHGQISDAANLILTPDGYNRLYSSPGETPAEHEAAKTVLRQLLSSHTLLFVGFSFEDERFGDQLHWLRSTFEGYAGNHFALVHQDDFAASERLGELPVTSIPFEDYGQPLVDLLRSFERVTVRGTYRIRSVRPIRERAVAEVRTALTELLAEPDLTVNDSEDRCELVVGGSQYGLYQLQESREDGSLDELLGSPVESITWTDSSTGAAGSAASRHRDNSLASHTLTEDVRFAALSDDTRRTLRQALLDAQLNEPRLLRSVFSVVPDLKPLPSWLLTAVEPADDLVDKTIDYVSQRQLASGRPALPLLIAIVRDRHDRDSALPGLLERVRLAVDAELSRLPSAATTGRQADRAAGTPHNSPRDLSPLGRDAELNLIVSIIVDHGQSVGIFGMPGVGKTTLAKSVFNRVKSHFFEDGFSWYEVKGKSLAEIIRLISRDFNVDIPEDVSLDEKKLALRRFLQCRRCLILLDDVTSNANVARELVGLESSCVFIITGNRTVDVSGMEQVSLGELPLADAVEMFTRLCATGKPDRSVLKHAKAVCNLLGCLPLALAIYASRVKLTGSLKSQDIKELRKVLDSLDVGEQSLRASFMLSYEELGETDRWLFALLGAFASAEFTADAVRAISQLQDAENRLVGLACRSLLRPQGGGRFSLHPLLKEFAKEQFDANFQDQSRIQRRMATYYFQYTLDHRHPLDALDVDAINILGCLRWCYEQTAERNVENLGSVVAELLDVEMKDCLPVMYILARLYKRRGNVDVAREFYESCLRAADRLGLSALQGACLRSLGEVFLRHTAGAKLGLDYINQARQVLLKAEDAQSRKEHVFTLNLLAKYYYAAGDYHQAQVVAEESLRVRDGIPREFWDGPEGLSAAATVLIRIHCENGLAQDALRLLEAERGNVEQTIDLPVCLGHVGILMAEHNPEVAANLFDDAFKLFDDVDNYGGCAWMQKCLGEMYLQHGDFDQAFERHLDALMFREHTDEQDLSAAALIDMARICYLTDKSDRGQEYWYRYQSLCQSLQPRMRNVERVVIAEALCRFARSMLKLDPDALSHLLLDTLQGAETLYETADNNGGVAYVHQLRGDFFLAISDGAKADDAYTVALAKRENMHDSRLLSEAFESIGDAYASDGQQDLAANYWRQALRTFEQLDESSAAERLRGKLPKVGQPFENDK